jgi:predicted flap endonuclease-1-like 5' DNA nuclease
VNGLTLLVLIALAVGIVVAYRAGISRGRRDARTAAPGSLAASGIVPRVEPSIDAAASAPAEPAAPPASEPPGVADIGAEKARIIVSLEGEAAALRRRTASIEAELAHTAALADERSELFRVIADVRAEAARYRQLVVDLENDAPPPLLDSPGAPDDLKLIVGVGPVLERMLQQLGISRYRQIARWSERDIDEFDARLPEFPGRIRRDAWVTQARELHHSKYGEALPPRERA